MKVTHITTIDIGGAYKAAMRLHEGLLRNGVDSCVLVRTRANSNSPVRPVFKSIIGESISKAKNVLNMLNADGKIAGDFLGTDLSNNEFVLRADIIVLHWINSFLSPKQIGKLFTLRKPVVWILHDMWPFTGGCHYDGYCGRYKVGCGKCPQVKHVGQNDLSSRNFKIKEKQFREMQGTIVGPSRWITECAADSNILKGRRICHIPNMLNTEVFRNLGEKNYCRTKYNLDTNKKTLIFGAADAGTGNATKGFQYVKEAMKVLKRTEYQLAVFGNADGAEEYLDKEGVQLLGFIKDEHALTEIYNAADLFVTPSLQEAFGYTACEAMACGTPVTAFNVGGLRDQIVHKKTGYLAEMGNIDDFVEGIMYCSQNLKSMQEQLATVSQRYSYEMIMPQYMELFERLLQQRDDLCVK